MLIFVPFGKLITQLDVSTKICIFFHYIKFFGKKTKNLTKANTVSGAKLYILVGMFLQAEAKWGT